MTFQNVLRFRPAALLRPLVSPAVQWVLFTSGVAFVGLHRSEPAAAPPIRAAERTDWDGFLALRFDDPSPRDEGRGAGPARLREQLEALVAHGYTFISLAEAREFLERRTPLPQRAVLLTFDDGAWDAVREAEAALAALQAPAVLFPRIDAMERSDHRYPAWHHLRVLARTGRWCFGSNGLRSRDPVPTGEADGTGPFLTTRARFASAGRVETAPEWRERVGADMRSSADILRRRLHGAAPEVFAFPWDDAGQAMADGGAELRGIVAETFPLAFTGSGYAFNHWRRPHLGLTRLPVDPEWTGAELVRRLDSQRSRRETYEPRSADEWVLSYGRPRVRRGVVDLDPEGHRGAESWLAGSECWRSVRGEVTIDTGPQIQTWLYLRASPAGGFLRIGWSGRRVELQAQVAREAPRTIAAGDPRAGAGVVSIEFELFEQRVRVRACGADFPARAFPVPRQLESGMAGLGVWYLEGSPESVRFRDLRLEPVRTRAALVRGLADLREGADCDAFDIVAPAWHELGVEEGRPSLRGTADPALLHLASHRGAALWPVVSVERLPPAASAAAVAEELRRAIRSAGGDGVLVDLRAVTAAAAPDILDILAGIADRVDAPVGLLADRTVLAAAACRPGLAGARLAAPEAEMLALEAPPERLLEIRSLPAR